MSCSARLPVYVVFGLAFFGARAGTVIWAMYALGIVVAMMAGMVFTRTILKPDATSAFVLELPPYRQPALKSVLIHMWENTREFVRKAGTLILFASVVMWFLLNLPWGVRDQRDSYFGRFSGAISPVFAPLGFGNWETGGALVTGFMAKEIVVSTMSQIYLGGEEMETVESTSLGEDLIGIGQGFVEATVSSGKNPVEHHPRCESGGRGKRTGRYRPEHRLAGPLHSIKRGRIAGVRPAICAVRCHTRRDQT
jgi:ferrous iron transport protein B